MRYQYNNKGLKAICEHCNKDYSEHKKYTLECPKKEFDNEF